MSIKKINKVSLYGAGLMAALALLTVIFVNIHISNTSDSVRAYVEEDVRNEAAKANDAIEMMMSKLRITAEVSAPTIGGMLSAEDSVVSSFLSSMTVESGGDYTALVVGEDLLLQDGKRIAVSSLEYKEEVAGTEGKFVFVKNDGISGNSAIAYIYPLSESDTSAYIITYLADSTFLKAFTLSGLHSSSFFAIIDDQAQVLCISGGDMNSGLLSGVLWTNMQNGAENSSKWILFNQKQREHMNSSIYCVSGNELRYCCMDSIDGTKWSQITGVNNTYIEKNIKKICSSASTLKIEIYLLMIAVVVVYILIIFMVMSTTEEKNKELEGKADTDLLTGLSNKISTENKIKEYLEWNPHSQGVMILIDVDNFKKINDTMGHAFGDEVLRNLGTRLRSLYRMSDIVGRLGGDEFVVFLKDIRDEDVIRRESHKLEVFFHGFEVGEYVKYSVTASLGAVVFPSDGDVFEELYQNADKALYTAKKAGKNRLVFYRDRNKTAEELDQISAELEAQLGETEETGEKVDQTSEITEAETTAEVAATETSEAVAVAVEATAEAETEAETKPEAEIEAETKPEAETEVETKPEAETEVETKAEADIEAESKTEPETEAESKSETEESAEASESLETSEEISAKKASKIIYRKKKKAENGEIVYIRENVIRYEDGSVEKITSGTIRLLDGEKVVIRNKESVDEREYRVVTKERVIRAVDGTVREITLADVK